MHVSTRIEPAWSVRCIRIVSARVFFRQHKRPRRPPRSRGRTRCCSQGLSIVRVAATGTTCAAWTYQRWHRALQIRAPDESSPPPWYGHHWALPSSSDDAGNFFCYSRRSSRRKYHSNVFTAIGRGAGAVPIFSDLQHCPDDIVDASDRRLFICVPRVSGKGRTVLGEGENIYFNFGRQTLLCL